MLRTRQSLRYLCARGALSVFSALSRNRVQPRALVSGAGGPRAGTADAPNVMIMRGRISGLVRGVIALVWHQHGRADFFSRVRYLCARVLSYLCAHCIRASGAREVS